MTPLGHLKVKRAALVSGDQSVRADASAPTSCHVSALICESIYI